MKILAFILVLLCQSYSPLAAQDQPKVKEPETLDEFFLLDAVGDIRPLERQTPQEGETPGNRSPIRFVQGEPLAFVVRLSPNQPVSPPLLRFVRLNAQGKNRVMEHVINVPGKGARYAHPVPFESTKYGDDSSKIKPKAALAPGEYAIGLSSKKDSFFFGVEAVKTDLK